MEAQYGNFLDMIRAVRINVPLVDVLAGMPNYGKFLKELVSNKHKLEQILATFLSDESSALIQNKVPPKLGDPRSFLIPYNFNKAFSCDALANLGASINLMSIAKNMLVEDGKFTFPVDFVILEMKEDIGTKSITFNMDSAMKHSYSNDDTCFSIDVIDEILEEDFDAVLDEGDLDIMEDKVDNSSPQSTPQVLPSFEVYTPPATYLKEVDETIGILMEVEPLDHTRLEDLGLNTCIHDLFLSSREIPSVDEPEPQLLPNFSPLDVNIGDKRGTNPPINPYSPVNIRMKVIFDEKKLAKKKSSASSRKRSSSFVDLVAGKYLGLKSTKWEKMQEQQDSYIQLKNQELDIEKAGCGN
ncbi:hypothetical protein Tco_0978604 [Tanacetum coccineum]|uniref:Reverse transcriptase domain-containing protein n=1 Tax=Tanacetum coccineum TaxID=301880 RepID=A0ABQ5ENV5_9ASTR